MTKGGALKSVRIVTSDELEVNGGRFKLRQGPAIKVRGYTTSNIGSRMVKGGDAQPVYVLSDTDIRSGGGRWRVTAGQAIPVTDVIGDARGVIQGSAIPVFPVDDSGAYDPSFSGLSAYAIKLLALNPIAYWPLWEASGTVAEDISGNNRDGNHNNVALGQSGIGDGRTSTGYDGATSYTDIWSTSFRDAFDGDEGTLFIVGKVSGAGVWTDGATRQYVRIAATGTDSIRIIKNAPNDRTQFTRVAGGVSKTFNRFENSVDWLFLAITWSVIDDEVIAYDNGVAIGAALNGLNPFGAAIAEGPTNIGSTSEVPAEVFDGDLAHCVVWDRALTPAEIAGISSV